jgi:2-keto-4-pentenoate hydratase
MVNKQNSDRIENAASALYEAFLEGKRIPNISKLYPGISLDEAYEIQKKYLEKRLTSDSIFGFKAGLCKEESQKKLSCSEPLSGVLYASGNFEGPDIPLSSSGKMVIETEIALIPGSDISRELESEEELRDIIEKVAPVIEFPDRNFEDTENFTAADMAASSVIAYGSYSGTPVAMKDIDINNIEVILYKNGEKITSGNGTSTWKNNQWKCALWLVNSVIKRGYTVKKGSFLFTGAISDVTPASKGSFRADYGCFGVMDFNII